jgi:hypothetical protein
MDLIENDAPNNYNFAYGFLVAVTSSSSPCLSTHSLRHARVMVGLIKYAVEMGSDAMIYIPSFIKFR